MSRHLLLRHGEASYALPVEVVHGVAPSCMATPLPRSPSWVEGVAAYGRDIVPQIALGALTGGAPGGAIAVVADSAAGKVALRVDAADRVIDIASRTVAPPGGPDLVCGVARRGRLSIGILDLGRLVLPVGGPATAPVESAPVAVPASRRPFDGEERRPATLLACLVGTRQIVFPLARVAAIEHAAPGRAAIDIGSARRPAPIAVTLRHEGAEIVVGIDRVLGLREEAGGAQPFDLAALFGASEPRAMGEGRSSIAVPLRQSALLLVAAGPRAALLPRTKVTRIGWTEHWSAMPGNQGGAGVTAVGGDIMPGLDFAGLFGDRAARRPIVVALDARGSRWALACDLVSERHAGIEGEPSTVDGIPRLGEAAVAEGRLPVLDVDRLPLPGRPS